MRNVAFEGDPRSARRHSRLALAVVCALALAVSLSACGAIDDAISFGKYVEATVEVRNAFGNTRRATKEIALPFSLEAPSHAALIQPTPEVVR